MPEKIQDKSNPDLFKQVTNLVPVLRNKVLEVVSSHDQLGSRELITQVLQVTAPYFSEDQILQYVKEDVFGVSGESDDSALKGEEIYYRKVIEDLLNEYILGGNQKLPEVFEINGTNPEGEHLTLNQIVQLASLHGEILGEKEQFDNQHKLKKIVELAYIVLSAIKKRALAENNKESVQGKVIILLKFIDDILKKSDKRAGHQNAYANKDSVLKMRASLDAGLPKNRYLIEGPLAIANIYEEHEGDQEYGKEYRNRVIEVHSITCRQKGVRGPILNSLSGKDEARDTIGVRMTSMTIKDSLAIYQSIMKRINDSFGQKVSKNSSLISFEDTNSDRFRERMDQLLTIEKALEHDWEKYVDDFEKDYILNNGGNIKKMLEKLLDDKNKIFILEGRYEEMVDKYYALLREASNLKVTGSDEYTTILRRADRLNSAIIRYREKELEPQEVAYYDRVEFARSLLVISGTKNNKSPIVGSGDKMKLHNNTRDVLRFFTDTLTGAGELNNLYYTKTKVKGSPFYVTNKSQVELGDGVTAEISSLPAWLLSYTEIIAPHDIYSKQKKHQIKRRLSQILKQVQ